MSRMGELIEAEAAARAADEAAKPCADCNGKAEKPRPRYEWHKPIMVRLFGTGCATCGSAGWVQKQIATPRRIVRFLSWVATLVPRAWSMVRTIVSWKVDRAEFFTRMKVCYDQSFGPNACAVRFLRHTKSGITETLHCGKCNCPKTALASLRRKNRKAGWRCPAGLHDGSNRDAAFQEYVQVQTTDPGTDGG